MLPQLQSVENKYETSSETKFFRTTLYRGKEYVELHFHSHVCIQGVQRQLDLYNVQGGFKYSKRQALRGISNHHEHVIKIIQF
jgi:hypothetical protein